MKKKIDTNATKLQKQGKNKGVGKEAWYVNLEKWKWPKGKSGNPKGRKPKTFAGIAKQWQREGYDQVTKEDIREAYQRMLVLDEKKLRVIVADLKQPMTLRIVARSLLAGKGFDVLERILDRTHGKSTENKNVKLEWGLADFLAQADE